LLDTKEPVIMVWVIWVNGNMLPVLKTWGTWIKFTVHSFDSLGIGGGLVICIKTYTSL
jgi:hypothetical protein